MRSSIVNVGAGPLLLCNECIAIRAGPFRLGTKV